MSEPGILDDRPLIAILRGLAPDKAAAVGDALCEAGLRALEVPLNSPHPLESIRILRDRLDGRVLVGAGTVLTADQAAAVADAGGEMIVSPNTDTGVIARTKALGLLSVPGFLTPSEAFSALAAGADALKLFPAEIAGRAGLKAMRAVLPAETRIYPVGGISPESIADWHAAGATGFGIGSALFTPDMTAGEIARRAGSFLAAWQALPSD